MSSERRLYRDGTTPVVLEPLDFLARALPRSG